MRAAVDILSKQASTYRIAVLGDMLELGDLGPALHASVGQFVGRIGIDCLITVGKLGESIADGAESAGMPQDPPLCQSGGGPGCAGRRSAPGCHHSGQGQPGHEV